MDWQYLNVVIEMLVSGLCYVSFAHPAEMGLTVQTLHVVAALSFLDWGHTTWTTVKFITSATRPLLKIQILALSARMPLLIALEAHLVGAVGAHRPALAATGLFYCCIALGSRAPLQLFIFCYIKIVHTLSKDHYLLLWHLQIKEIFDLVLPFTRIALHARYFRCQVVIYSYFEVISDTIQTIGVPTS